MMLFKLVRINLLTFFDIHKLVNAKSLSDYKKILPKIFLYVYAFGVLLFSVYRFSTFALEGLSASGLEALLLVALMAITSAYLVFSTVLKVNKTVFDAKDYNMLLGLPIKKTTIISSKIFILYISNLIYTVVFMLPAYMAYAINTSPSLLFHILFLSSMLFIPVIPTIIGSIIGSLITALISNFKHKTLLTIIISFIFLIVVMWGSMASGRLTTSDLVNISESIVNYFNRIYPLAKMYLDIIKDQSIMAFLIYTGVSLGCFWLFQYILSHFFDSINSKLNSVTISNQYQKLKLKRSTTLMALYKKELKKYLSSVIYVLNTGVGAVLLIIALIILAFVGSEQLDMFLSIPGVSNYFILYAPIIFCTFSSLSSTTNSSISLEGKSLWLLKSLPVSIGKIFWAKILVNLTILIPTIIIGAGLLSFILELNLEAILVLLFTPITFAFFIAGFGLLMNLYFPDFEWTNEIKVIKQSIAVFITLASGMLLSILPLLIKVDLNPNYYSLLFGLFMFIIVVVTYYVLFTSGKRLFKKL